METLAPEPVVTHVAVGVVDEAVPRTFALRANYPNPFNPSTPIRYTLPAPGRVSPRVYDFTGRHVATLVDGVALPGVYAVRWNAAGLASGVYFCRL